MGGWVWGLLVRGRGRWGRRLTWTSFWDDLQTTNESGVQQDEQRVGGFHLLTVLHSRGREEIRQRWEIKLESTWEHRRNTVTHWNSEQLLRNNQINNNNNNYNNRKYQKVLLGENGPGENVDTEQPNSNANNNKNNKWFWNANLKTAHTWTSAHRLSRHFWIKNK